MKFIANLNGTLLYPYQLFIDLSEQIPNSPPQIKNLAVMPLCELNSTNDWINLESLGKPVALRAKALCDVISSLLKKLSLNELELDLYLADSHLTSDNLYSLLYLAENLDSLVLNFYIEKANQIALSEKITALSELSEVSIRYYNNEEFSEQARVLSLQQARAQAIKQLGFQLSEESFSTAAFHEGVLQQMIGYSWMCLKAGAYEISCLLLEKCQRAQVSQAMQEDLFMHLLMMRFFSHQYALIAQSDFPKVFVALKEDEIRTLQFLTAYAATLSRNLDVAQTFFDQCQINPDLVLTDETSLYQLNLFALSRVLRGEIDLAFALEFRIRDFIAEKQIETVGLNYVNYINIARLYKKTKEYDLSLDYYNKAYNQISGGGYATSDHIYYNMNLGSLFEASADYNRALTYWVKAAIHWLGNKNQYELSWRPRLILCNEKIADVSKPLPRDKAHRFLSEKIKELLAKTGVVLQESGQCFQFVDDSSLLKKEQCFVSQNIVLFSTTGAVSAKSSASLIELAQLVSHYLLTVMEIPSSCDTLIIDTHWDAQVIHDSAQALAYTQLSNCENCYFNGKWLQKDTPHSLKSLRASLSKVIQSITATDKGLTVQYKRSFLNKTLQSQEEIALVNQLQRQDEHSLQNWSAMDLQVIRQLVKKRVVNFS
ncbi:MAG: hypothetical protein EPN84_08070 [Legionella sp.]|nr:MAG: hypothetical protein EPN84_08070 [Legionella sp.]